jgi:hypothetical protein
MPRTPHVESHCTSSAIAMGLGGKRPFRSSWQTAVVGGLAAAAAFAIAKLIA